MPGFDIRSILDFDPPRYACPACRGLFTRLASTKGTDRLKRPWIYRCPVCEGEFVPDATSWPDTTSWDEVTSPYAWLKDEGHQINHGSELMDHSKVLAQLLRKAEGSPFSAPWPTVRLLFEVLNRARHFVHFTTYGISHVMIGALKMTSMRVPVYGFASNVEANTRAELSEMPDEAPDFNAKVIPSATTVQDAPHQKLIVVDGLLAFKGSANLTNTGLRKADRGLDISEVVTDYAQVTALNNKYFAPVWKRITAGTSDQIVMTPGPPF